MISQKELSFREYKRQNEKLVYTPSSNEAPSNIKIKVIPPRIPRKIVKNTKHGEVKLLNK